MGETLLGKKKKQRSKVFGADCGRAASDQNRKGVQGISIYGPGAKIGFTKFRNCFYYIQFFHFVSRSGRDNIAIMLNFRFGFFKGKSFSV